MTKQIRPFLYEHLQYILSHYPFDIVRALDVEPEIRDNADLDAKTRILAGWVLYWIDAYRQDTSSTWNFNPSSVS